MTPREMAEACLIEMHPHASSEERYAHLCWLATVAPALARDLIAAMDEAEKMRAVVEAARAFVDAEAEDYESVATCDAARALCNALAALDAAKGGE